ncbi:MAG TPA: YHS domain-containing protein [Thermodesulfobacteriaceae bacterium]|nr:YHS domain-containing protein [Thermodesulfobacteriaceae bacterium]
MKLLLFLLLILALYYLIKNWLSGKRSRPGGRTETRGSKKTGSLPPVTDELVQDPVCGVYCPKKTSHSMTWKNKIYYFCSEDCKRKFLEENRG